MMEKKIITASMFMISFLLTSNVVAAEYASGFVWDRSNDWTPGAAVGSTIGNPGTDMLGNPVWSYEYTSGGALGASNAWFLQPKHLMIWDNWNPPGPAAEQLWVRADNSEPKINQYNLSHSRSLKWNAWDYQSLVRWTNPVGEGTLVNIGGALAVEWGGWGVSPEVDVDVIIARKDSSTNSLELLVAQTISNPKANQPNPPFPRVKIPLSFSNVRMDENDSFLISARAATAPSTLDSWIILYDDAKITYVSTVPEPQSYVSFTVGLGLVAGLLRFRRRVK